MQAAADRGHRRLAVGIVGHLGRGGVAEHGHRARHVAQFVGAVRLDHDVMPSAGELRHRIGQQRDRPRDLAAEQDGQGDCHTDQRDAADGQRDQCGQDRLFLAGRGRLDVLRFRGAQIAQGEGDLADEHRRSRVPHRLLRFVAVPGLHPADQPVAPVTAPFQRFATGRVELAQLDRIGQQRIQFCGGPVELLARFLV